METKIQTAIIEKQHSLTWGKALLFGAVYIGLTILLGIAAFFISIIWDLVNGTNVAASFFNHVDYLMLLDGLAFFITLFIFKSVRGFLKGSFSFAPLKKGKTYLYLFGSFIVLFFLQFFILNVMQWEDGADQIQTFGVHDLSFDYFSVMIFYLALVIITPIKEEILFRGVFHGFLAKKINVWVGLFVSSIIFGLLHTGHALSAALMGIVLVVLYHLTRSLIVPILFHVLWNFYAVSALLAYAAYTA